MEADTDGTPLVLWLTATLTPHTCPAPPAPNGMAPTSSLSCGGFPNVLTCIKANWGVCWKMLQISLNIVQECAVVVFFNRLSGWFLSSFKFENHWAWCRHSRALLFYCSLDQISLVFQLPTTQDSFLWPSFSCYSWLRLPETFESFTLFFYL